MHESLVTRAETLQGNINFSAAYAMLSYEEKVAVNAYTDDLYANLNKMLRGAVFESEHQKILEELVTIIFNALYKMLPKYKGRVFRGSNLENDVLLEYVNAFKNNAVISHSFSHQHQKVY